MTVRLNPTESDSTPQPQVHAPLHSSDDPVTAPADGPTEPAPEDGPHEAPVDAGGTDGAGGTDSRITLREARRQRRRTAWLCAAVVAVCLGLTIVVVSLARTRPAPLPGVVATYAVAVPSITAPAGTSLPSDPHPGAPAPEGANP
jgi:hypothetical protein